MADTQTLITAGAGPNSRDVNATQTQLPSWVNEGSQSLWNAAVNTANQGYTPYDGARVADFNPDMQAGFQGTRDAAGAATPALGTAMNMTKAGATGWAGALPSTAPISVGDIGPIAHVGADQNKTGMWDQGAYDTYKNPWDKNVLDTTTAEMDRKAAIDSRDARARAATGGAFGGSRGTLLETETNRNNNQLRNNTVADLNSKGFTNAQGMFTSDQSRALQNDQGNANRKLSADQGNQSTDFNVGQQNQNTRLAVAKANQAGSMFDTGNQLSQFNTDQSRKLTAGNQLTSQASTGHDIATTDNNNLLKIGSAQMVKDQASLDQRHQDFTDQRDYDKNNIDWLGKTLNSLPTDTTSVNDSVTGSATPVGQQQGGSGLGQAIGAATSIASMFV